MTEEKDKIAKLEERLEKAAATFKEMKTQMDSKDQEIEALKSRIVELEGNSDTVTLRARIADLEDELTLNGGAVQEVEGLKVRLDKAKVIFADQKAKIAELTEAVNEKEQTIEEVRSDLDAAAKTCSELTERVHALEGDNATLKSTLDRVREIVNV